MKVYKNILTSGSSGLWNWSAAFPIFRHAKNGIFNLEWKIIGEDLSTGVTFAYSGCSTEAGTYSASTGYIMLSATSVSGPNADGRDFSKFVPALFPFMKIGAQATGTTTTLDATLVVA